MSNPIDELLDDVVRRGSGFTQELRDVIQAAYNRGWKHAQEVAVCHKEDAEKCAAVRLTGGTRLSTVLSTT